MTNHDRQILALQSAYRRAKTPEAARKIKEKIREVEAKQQQNKWLAQ